MPASLTITKPGESWGSPEARTHQQESTLKADDLGGHVRFTIHRGACNSAHHGGSTPEALAALYLPRADVVTLAAFLASLPPEESA